MRNSYPDRIIDGIRSKDIRSDNISFELLKKTGSRQNGLWSELKRGEAILTTVEQLDQYLHSYGPMISSQWENVVQRITLPAGDIQIVDYGCGQCLASSLYLDALKSKGRPICSKFILIDPSLVALRRARRIAKCYFPGAALTTINKRFDDLVEADIRLRQTPENVHLFSNILDIPGVSVQKLVDHVLSQEGVQYIVAVSHDRDFNGGSKQLKEFYSTITSTSKGNRCRVLNKKWDNFTCDNGMKAVFFSMELESYGLTH